MHFTDFLIIKATYFFSLGSNKLPVEPDLDDQVLFPLILHLLNHSMEFFAGLVKSSLVSFNPDNGDTTVSVRNVDGDATIANPVLEVHWLEIPIQSWLSPLHPEDHQL